MSKYFVVVPVYNEQKNIRRCIKHIQEYWKDIIVVNDGSTDNTLQILERFRSIHIVNLETNHGKGYAMMQGANLAWRLKASGIVFMDGDRQHNPKFIPTFVNYLEKKVDVVIGIRRLKINIPLHRKIGNVIMVMIMRYMFGVTVPDMLCGFRALTKRGFNRIKWKSQRYGVEVEMLTIISKKKIPYKSIVVDTIYHEHYKGLSLFDGIEIMLHLPYWKLRRT